VTRLAVIDHGAGNLVSIEHGLIRAGAGVHIVARPGDMDDVDGVVLPGVGSSGAVMRRLTETGLDRVLREWEGPLLGICVGFQVLFDGSLEDPEPCLGIMPGSVERLTGSPLPHMGWNDVDVRQSDPVLTSDELFYFVHSFAPVPGPGVTRLATTFYDGQEIVVAARRELAVGVQFHPERSGEAGRRLLGAFIADCEERARAA
jgi:imidazole glycerol phosphate synthase glutamine amidotransferase subunit